MSELSERDKQNIWKVRLIEGAREAGILLMVFSPLDIVIGVKTDPVTCNGAVCASPEAHWPLLSFLVGGLVLFIGSILVEGRYYSAD